MNPALKRELRNRGESFNPRDWQRNAEQAPRCPVCKEPMLIHGSDYFCFRCGE